MTIFYGAKADELNIIPIRGETFYSFEDFKEVSEYLKEVLNIEGFINFQIFLILSEDALKEQSEIRKYFESAEIFSLPMEVINLYNDFLEKKEIADCNSSLKQIKNDYTIQEKKFKTEKDALNAKIAFLEKKINELEKTNSKLNKQIENLKKQEKIKRTVIWVKDSEGKYFEKAIDDKTYVKKNSLLGLLNSKKERSDLSFLWTLTSAIDNDWTTEFTAKQNGYVYWFNKPIKARGKYILGVISSSKDEDKKQLRSFAIREI